MERALAKGNIVMFRGEEYTITGIHSIEPDNIIYNVTGDGYKRLLSSNEISYDETTATWHDVYEYWHYALDFETGIVHEHITYALKIKNDMPERKNYKVVLFNPDFKGFFWSDSLERVTKDYQIILEKRDFDKAHVTISSAVYDRCMYFATKYETYNALVLKMAR